MKNNTTCRLSALLAMLIFLVASCSKDSPIVPAPAPPPASGPVQTVPPTIPPWPSNSVNNSQNPNSPSISMEIKPDDWIDKGNNRFVFELKPRIGKLPNELWEYSPDRVQIAPGSPDMLVIIQGNTIQYEWGYLSFKSFELELQTSNGVLPPTFDLKLDLELL